MRYYSVYDTAAKEFSPPFPAKTDAVALRHFRNYLDTIPKNVSHNDFDIYFIFDFDDVEGKVSNNEPAVLLYGSLKEEL